MRVMEKIGQERAEVQLRRMGYTPEKIDKMTNENLGGWV